MTTQIQEHIKERYGNIALGGNSCCDPSEPVETTEPGKLSGSDVFSLGCGTGGSGEAKKGETVLDIGSGTGLEAFRSAELVGPDGRIIGIDITDEMLEKSRRNAEKLGLSNVEFRKGDAANIPLENDTVDLVISNCVINLTEDKKKVFSEVHRVLKPGGRMVVQDIVTREPLPDNVRQDAAAWASCIGGAIPQDEYIGAIETAGFGDVEIDESSSWKAGSNELLSIRVRGYKN